MKNYTHKKEKNNTLLLLWLALPLLSLALYILHIASGYKNTDGILFIAYENSYPLILLAEYTLITLMLIPFILKAKHNEELSIHLLPLLLISALGMMRIDSSVQIAGDKADHAPAIMFIIFFAAILIMAFSGHTVSGAAGTLIGTALYPAFGIAFSPFIAASSFIFNDSNKKEKKASVIINGAVCATALIYGIIRLDPQEFSFSRKYIPVLLLCAALIAFFGIKKEYSLIPLGILPLLPLAAGIFAGVFPTALFTLSASVAPLAVILTVCALTDGSEKIKGHALSIVHNPVLYVVLSVFIIHTAFPIFANPGYFYDYYM